MFERMYLALPSAVRALPLVSLLLCAACASENSDVFEDGGAGSGGDPSTGGQPTLHAEVKVYDTVHSVGPDYHVVRNAYWKRADGSLQMLQDGADMLTDATGMAVFDVPLPSADPSPGTIYFVVRKVIPRPGALPWARGLDEAIIETLAY